MRLRDPCSCRAVSSSDDLTVSKTLRFRRLKFGQRLPLSTLFRGAGHGPHDGRDDQGRVTGAAA